MWKMVSEGSYYFLSRPCRFGKVCGITEEELRNVIVVQTPGYVYILELKIDQSADAALRQIEDKGCALPFVGGRRQLFKIGINFSSETKRIDDWKIL